MQVHFQFLSQALQKVQPVAQSCLAEALAQAQERCANARSQSADLGPLTELEDASRSWKGAAQVCSPRIIPGRCEHVMFCTPENPNSCKVGGFVQGLN